MPEEIMPAVEAQAEEAADEAAHYECAFHVLPTIADEEAPHVVSELRSLLARAGGTVTDEEAPERPDLAYEVIKQVDGVNRRFNAAHFGWIRFTLAPRALPQCLDELKHRPELLRYLVIRLTKEETQHPFFIAETRRERGGEDVAIAEVERGKTSDKTRSDMSDKVVARVEEKGTE